MTTVLVAHSDAEAGARVGSVLEQAGARVVDVVSTTPTLAHRCRRAAPDVVVSTVRLDDGPLLPSVPQVLRLSARLVILCDYPPGTDVRQTLLAGAAGCVTDIDDLPQAVETVAAGGAALHPVAAETVLQHWRSTAGAPTTVSSRPLTARECEVLQLAAGGLTNASIATRLGLSTKTVESHKARIFGKLGTRNQAEAIAAAISDGSLVPVRGRTG